MFLCTCSAYSLIYAAVFMASRVPTRRAIIAASRSAGAAMQPGKDYIGVGVGAMIFDAAGKVFLAQRGPQAGNERGSWEFPGGKVDFGEKLEDAIRREFAEEYGMVIAVDDLLGVSDHILVAEGQHWIAPTFVGRQVGGTVRIMEPEKCSAIGWFALDALPQPLSQVTREDVRMYRAKYGPRDLLSGPAIC